MENLFKKYNLELSDKNKLLFDNYYNDLIEKNKFN